LIRVIASFSLAVTLRRIIQAMQNPGARSDYLAPPLEGALTAAKASSSTRKETRSALMVHRLLEVSLEKGYIAFSLDTPDSIVQTWQKSLTEMKEDGTFESIWKKWYEGVELS
jgi:ABC-type amino acid transport substrate-binding protein